MKSTVLVKTTFDASIPFSNLQPRHANGELTVPRLLRSSSSGMVVPRNSVEMSRWRHALRIAACTFATRPPQGVEEAGVMPAAIALSVNNASVASRVGKVVRRQARMSGLAVRAAAIFPLRVGTALPCRCTYISFKVPRSVAWGEGSVSLELSSKRLVYDSSSALGSEAGRFLGRESARNASAEHYLRLLTDRARMPAAAVGLASGRQRLNRRAVRLGGG